MIKFLQAELTCELTLASLIENGKTVKIAGENFIVPAPIHLLAMKLHSISSNIDRELKDFPDVIQLIKLCEIDPSDDAIISLFKNMI